MIPRPWTAEGMSRMAVIYLIVIVIVGGGRVGWDEELLHAISEGCTNFDMIVGRRMFS